MLYLIAYTSEGMNLEEDIKYLVRAPDQPKAYLALFTHFLREDPENHYVKNNLLPELANDYSILLTFTDESQLHSFDPGFNICEVE